MKLRTSNSVTTPIFYLEPNEKFYSAKDQLPYGDLAICRRSLQERVRVPLTSKIQFEIIKNNKSGKYYLDCEGALKFPHLMGPRGNLHVMIGSAHWLKNHTRGFKRFDIDILLLGD